MVAAVRIVRREALVTDVYLKHIEQEKNNAADGEKTQSSASAPLTVSESLMLRK